MKKTIIAICVSLAIINLSGCAPSALSSIAGAVGGKPDVTAQVGAENTKQAVGLNNKVDTSSDVKNEIKNSKVDKLDTSNGKKVSTSSIQADTITADRIEIRNGDLSIAQWLGIFLSGVGVAIIAFLAWSFKRKRG